MPMVNTQPPPPTQAYAYTGQNPQAGGSGHRRDLSQQQRSQILSSLLQAPNQYTKDYLSQAQAQQTHQPRQPSASHHGRPQQSLHPSQQWQDPQFLAEQQGIYRSIQESRTHAHARGQPQPVQQADSWGYMGGGGWGERASTIPEEDEYDDEEEDDDGWGRPPGAVGMVAGEPAPQITDVFDSLPTYLILPLLEIERTRCRAIHRQRRNNTTPNANASKTMKFATGQISTTVFELAPPRNGLGETSFIDSHGAALRPAERAMFSRDRPAKERFRWGFNPDKDPRVGTLLRWIASTANGLAEIGVSRASIASTVSG
ncbi:hypothetical protein NUW54_g14716 [Trametes sanguinea]|uniref:Uncharacterized protein n=1 Tax=Trametes sanguinea TaxID=158606 RepID=A0ACC1MBL8_9APHY|nr:hypothetical protein NUW54_g14716 [Trametes sanguinea]